MLKNGAQSFIKTIGDEGCYALCLCKVAETGSSYNVNFNAVRAIEKGIKEGSIKEDMAVLDGAAFLKLTTLQAWTKEYKDADYAPQKGDCLVAEWFNKRTGLTHFTLEYPVKRDGLKDSVTVKEGAIRSYRLYRVKA
jgi:hypothetical protein